MPRAVVTIKLSDAATEVLEGFVDLLTLIEKADPALLPDDIAEKASELRELFDHGRGDV